MISNGYKIEKAFPEMEKAFSQQIGIYLLLYNSIDCHITL